MGAFGGPTPKPLKFFSSYRNIDMLRRPRPKGLAKLTKRSANGKWVGGLPMMSASQAYPPEFGLAVAKLFKDNFRCKQQKKRFTLVVAKLFWENSNRKRNKERHPRWRSGGLAVRGVGVRIPDVVDISDGDT